MGILFGKNTGSRSYTYSSELAEKLTEKGGGRTAGGSRLLGFMAGRSGPADPIDLNPADARDAAAELTQAARRLRGRDREIAEQIAADAQAAAESGKPWRVG